jgi:hypothetical protein
MTERERVEQRMSAVFTPEGGYVLKLERVESV